MNAIYPGSFDPLTRGHLSIIQRSLKLFPFLTVLVANNPSKQYMFTLQERCDLVMHAVSLEIDAANKRIRVQPWESFTYEYINENATDVIIRGIRNDTDLHYEEDLETFHSDMTRAQTIYLRPELEHYRTSSSLARMYIQTGAYDQLLKYMTKDTIDFIIHKRKEKAK